MRRWTAWRTALVLVVVASLAVGGACRGQGEESPDLEAGLFEAPAAPALAAYRYNASLPLELTVENPVAADGYISQKVYFTSVGGARVSALLVMPEKAGKPPVLLEMTGLAQTKDDANSIAKIVGPLGVAVFAIDMPLHGERGQSSNDWNAFRDRSLGPRLMRQTVFDNLRALDLLRAEEALDGSRIALLGGSMGANLGAIVTAVDRGIKGACLVSGVATPGPGPGTFVQSSDPSRADVDPTAFLGLISPRPVLVMTGAADKGVPLAYAEAFFAAARHPKDFYVYPGGHVEINATNGSAQKLCEWLYQTLGLWNVAPAAGGEQAATARDEPGAALTSPAEEPPATTH